MATTAQKLIAYRLELREAGLDHDLVNDLVKDAAQTMVMHEGLQVRSFEGDSVDQHTTATT